MALFELPDDLFGEEAALFFVLGIPLALGIAFGGSLWRRGNRWFESAMEMIERFVEERLEAHLAKQGARQNVQAMAEPAAPDRNPPDPR